MRNLRIFICVIALILFSTSPLFAGNAENKDGWSAEWVRTLNRNASTDSADAVVYNPAGVLRLENGNYLNLSVIHGRPDFSHTVSGTVYENDTANSPPGFHALIKQDKWAAFASFTITAGGGDAEYANGSNTTNTLGGQYMTGANAAIPGVDPYDSISQQGLTAESIHRSFTLGGAYRLNKEVSLSVGSRYIDATKKTDGSVTINASSGLAPDQSASVGYDETADGWGGIVGINYVPREDLNIGMRYETKTTLDFHTRERADDLGVVTDGAKARRDLPGVIGIGAAYQVSPKLKAETDFTYFLNKSADWADSALTAADETKADNGFNLGIALEYAFRTKLKGSLGYQYMDTGIDTDNMKPEDPQLNAHLLGAGFAYKVMPDMDVNFGLARIFYKDETTSTGIKLDKKALLVALGIQYEFK